MTDFSSWDFKNWSYMMIPVFSSIIMIGMEILSFIVPAIFGLFCSKKIPIKGKHLDAFDATDNLYIFINKLLTVCFVYHLIWVCYYCSSIKWRPEEANIYNTFGSLIFFYIFYDFFYANFHRLLHVRELYPLIHKHHHRQKAPSRGNLDAINVHPFEFLVGEYLHLVTVWFIPCHVYAVAFFVVFGGIVASLNHTRFDINIPLLYSVSNHDVHHSTSPLSNYGQYIMLWDWIQGSYRPYGSKAPPLAQEE